MKRFPKGSILFRVKQRNGAATEIGDIVEFVGYYDSWAISAVGIDGNKPEWMDGWVYHPTSVEPLTPLAREVLAGLAS